VSPYASSPRSTVRTCLSPWRRGAEGCVSRGTEARIVWTGADVVSYATIPGGAMAAASACRGTWCWAPRGGRYDQIRGHYQWDRLTGTPVHPMIRSSPDSTRPRGRRPTRATRRRAGLNQYAAPATECHGRWSSSRPVPTRRSPKGTTRHHALTRHHECRGASRQLDAPDAPQGGQRDPTLLRHQRLHLLPRHRRARRSRPLRDLRLQPQAQLGAPAHHTRLRGRSNPPLARAIPAGPHGPAVRFRHQSVRRAATKKGKDNHVRAAARAVEVPTEPGD